MSDWGDAIAHRGELTVVVMTKARALSGTIKIVPHRGCDFVLELHPDGAAPVLMSSESVETVRNFVQTMAPRDVEVLVAEREEEHVIRAALKLPPRLTL